MLLDLTTLLLPLLSPPLHWKIWLLCALPRGGTRADGVFGGVSWVRAGLLASLARPRDTGKTLQDRGWQGLRSVQRTRCLGQGPRADPVLAPMLAPVLAPVLDPVLAPVLAPALALCWPPRWPLCWPCAGPCAGPVLALCWPPCWPCAGPCAGPRAGPVLAPCWPAVGSEVPPLSSSINTRRGTSFCRAGRPSVP